MMTDHDTPTNGNMIVLFVMAFLTSSGANTSGFADETKCQKFADGSVYPSSNTEFTNHKLQYTKALSEWPFDLLLRRAGKRVFER